MNTAYELPNKQFNNAIRDLNPVSDKSSLIGVSPCLDSDEILRVVGRLGNSSLPYGVKRPTCPTPKQSFDSPVDFTDLGISLPNVPLHNFDKGFGVLAAWW